MRTTIGILLTAVGLIAANVYAKPPTVVYPTGIFPTDVQNVQAAINQGGTVLLKATDSVGHPLAFNFGAHDDHSGVDIVNDVSIAGELAGANRTTISGGDTPVVVFGGKNSIAGIKFIAPAGRAIAIRRSTGTSVVNNEIDNVVPVLLSGLGFTKSDGIDVTPVNPANVSGNLVISGNTIGDLAGGFAIGIQVDSVAANVTISNNTFQLGQSASDLGFVNSGAIGCVRCHSAVTISGNAITLGPGFVLNGIGIVGDADARYHVFGNTINTASPFADGIDAVGVTGDPGVMVSAVIENNPINLLNTDTQFGSGIGLLGSVMSSVIQGNVVTGSGPSALFTVGSLTPDGLVTRNRFLFNDIASVNASVATIVFFDDQSVNNTVRGQCVSVLDLGINNDISCPASHSNVNSSAFVTRQQMLQRALQAQSAVHAQSNDVNRQ